MTEVELAWVAGYLEGEGSFIVSPKLATTGETYPTFGVRANSTDEDVLEKLYRIAGGHLCGPTIPKNPKHRPFWRWGISKRDDCYALAVAVRPLLGQRRRIQVDRLLAAYECSGRAKWKHGTRQGYEYHKCKCGLCRASNTTRHRERRQKKREAASADIAGYAATLELVMERRAP